MSNPRTALVLGATGGIGGEVARTLAARGWRVRGFARRPQAGRDGLDWRQGDAMVAGRGRRGGRGRRADRARGQPAGLPRLGPAGAADAREHDRRRPRGRRGDPVARHGLQLRPGRLPAGRRGRAAAPVTRKGAIRVAMEARLREAAAAGTPVLVVRAGDFFGPRAGNNWFSQGLVKPGQPAAVDHPARRPRRRPRLGLPARRRRDDGAAHRGRRAERLRQLPHGRPLGPRRHGDAERDPRRARRARPAAAPDALAAAAARRPAGAAVPRARRDALPLAQPVRLDNRRLLAALGEEPRTPLDRAVRETLTGLGCLPGPSRAPLPAREAPRISYRLANLESFTLHDTGAPTSANPASAREEGSGATAGGREAAAGGRSAAARARGPGGTAQPARFVPEGVGRVSVPSRRCASRAAARRCARTRRRPRPRGRARRARRRRRRSAAPWPRRARRPA